MMNRRHRKRKEKIETVRDLYYENAVQIKLEAEL